MEETHHNIEKEKYKTNFKQKNKAGFNINFSNINFLKRGKKILEQNLQKKGF